MPFLVLVLFFLRVFRTDGQDITLEIEVDILFFEAGQFGLKQIAVTLVQNVGAETGDTGVQAVKKALLDIVQILKQVAFIASKRNQVKHTTYLHLIGSV